MPGDGNSQEFKVIAKDCGDCGCGCPTVMEGGSPEDVVIVGKLDAIVLNSAAVQKHTGEGEIAVVIPKSLLIEAAKALRLA
ncbi:MULTISPECIES: hypothetical protein [Rhodomicrobium]|uniref:hypothetical protein n=1 Tax=Rhodomicrobium TaxID=1068 RepID=UPI000F738320|nr:MULTISPECIES: hypothetical protein [Rhodomicrobium]